MVLTAEEKKERKKEYDRLYRQKNKEKLREKDRLYRENNKEYNKEYHRLYYEKNKEKRKESDRLYKENNKEKEKERCRLYYENNKEKIKEYDRLYYEKNKEKRKEYYKTENGKKVSIINRWKFYGVKNDDFDKLYDYYLNCKFCEECKIELITGNKGANRKCLDHDHDTCLVRNVLCHTCNVKRGFIDKGTIKLTPAEKKFNYKLKAFIFS